MTYVVYSVGHVILLVGGGVDAALLHGAGLFVGSVLGPRVARRLPSNVLRLLAAGLVSPGS